MPASFQDIVLAFDFVGSSGGGFHLAILCGRTGKIYWHSEFSDLDEFNDELPDDIEDDGKYIAIPDKRELGLGKPLALDLRADFCLVTSQARRLPEVSGPVDAKKRP